MFRYRLDVSEIFRLCDVQRITRGMSWRGVARELGVSASTFSRLSHGKSPDAHGLVALMIWLDLDVGQITRLEEKVSVHSVSDR